MIKTQFKSIVNATLIAHFIQIHDFVLSMIRMFFILIHYVKTCSLTSFKSLREHELMLQLHNKEGMDLHLMLDVYFYTFKWPYILEVSFKLTAYNVMAGMVGSSTTNKPS